jgi:MFS family permease
MPVNSKRLPGPMRGTLLYLNVAHFLDHYFLLIFPTAVLVIYPAWGMSYGEALALMTPSLVVFALATPLAGWLGDRHGEIPMMILFFIGIGLSSIATGLATGPISLAVGLTAIGLFAAIYHPVGTAFVVRLAKRTGAALGVNGVFGNMGVAAAAGITGLIAASLGWRAAFILPGAMTVAIGIAFALQAKPAPEAEYGSGDRPLTEASRRDQVRILVVVAIAALFGGMAFHGVTIALPKLFQERLADTVGIAEIGLYATIVFGIAAFAQIPIGLLLDRLGAKPIMITLTALQVILLAVIAQLHGMIAVIVAIPLMLVVFGEIPVGTWLVGRYVPPSWRSRAYSIQFLLALGVSSAVVPMIAILHGYTGSQTALFLALSGCMAVVFLSAIALLPAWRSAVPRPQAMPAQ